MVSTDRAEKDDSQPRASEARWYLAAVVVALLFGGVAVYAMVTPFDDWVPLDGATQAPVARPGRGGAEPVDPNQLPHSARFRCSAPFGGDESAVASPEAVDALELQGLQREPCASIRRQYRMIGIVDLVAVAAVLAVVFVVHRRRRDRDLVADAPGL